MAVTWMSAGPARMSASWVNGGHHLRLLSALERLETAGRGAVSPAVLPHCEWWVAALGLGWFA